LEPDAQSLEQTVEQSSKVVAVARNRKFLSLWSAQVLSQIAQNLLNFALIITVYQLAQATRFANISVALLILSFGIPSIFFAAAAGVYVDHWNKKIVLVTANFLRAALVLGYLFVEHDLALTLLLTFTISAITQFFAPAEAAAIPALVKPRQLLRANSLFVFTLYASFIIGYSASGPVLAVFGIHGPYFVTSIMFALAGILVTFLPSIKVKQRREMSFKQVMKYTMHEVWQNWQVIRANHNLSFPITQLTITQAILGVVLALAPALSVAILRAPIEDSSHVLVIPAGIGMVLGVSVIGRLDKKYSKFRIISVGLIAAGAALIFFGLTSLLHKNVHGHQFAPDGIVTLSVAILLLILGFMNAVVSATSQTILQENTTEQTRGKVFGALNMLINVAATLPILFAATLADLTSVNKVIGTLGLCLTVFAVYQYLELKRRRRLG
jgi:MFS family permease